MINLVSDTLTKPTTGMLTAMFEAKVGDDVFRDDPTVNALEAKVAKMFNKQAALFCPSGTMTNQLAIKIHTHPLDEMICDKDSHVYQYETAGYAFNSGIGVNLIDGEHGKITPEQLDQAVKPLYDWLPVSRLCVIENSCNKGGGSYYTYEEMKALQSVCEKRELKFHLDGARIFNVLVETHDKTEAIGELFDTISICLSKGLGAPVGSLLIGDSEDIDRARRFRKVMGGGMRQAGYLAAAGIYALDNHIDRLKIDNARAKSVGLLLEKMAYVKTVKPVKTNIVIFDLKEPFTAVYVLNKFQQMGIKASTLGPKSIRLVFHLDITEAMMEELMEKLPAV